MFDAACSIISMRVAISPFTVIASLDGRLAVIR